MSRASVMEKPPAAVEGEMRAAAVAMLADSPYQPRKTYDEAYLDELAASIRERGLLSPPLVRPRGDGDGYEIIVGHCRVRGALRAGLSEIPVVVRDMSDGEVMLVQLVENQQRRDLSPLDEAEALARLVERARTEGGSAVDRVAQRLGLSSSQVFARIKLLDLVDEAKAKLRSGELSATVAVQLARVPRELQPDALDDLVAPWREGISTREAEQILRASYLLKLTAAPWGLNDATLRPEAGACDGCPHRTTRDVGMGAAAAGADLCLEPACYGEKLRLHTARVVEAAKASGTRVVEDPKQAAKLLKDHRYVRVDDHIATPTGKLRTYDDVLDRASSVGLPTPQETLVIEEDGGAQKVVRLLKRDGREGALELAQKFVQESGNKKAKTPGHTRPGTASGDDARAAHEKERIRKLAVAELYARARKSKPEVKHWILLLKLVSRFAALNRPPDALPLERKGGELVPVGKLSPEQAFACCLTLLAAEDDMLGDEGETLEGACQLYGIDIGALAAAPPPPKPGPSKKAKQARPKGGKARKR